MTGRVHIHARIKEETYTTLRQLATLNKEPVSVLMRRLLARGLDTNTVEPDALSVVVRKAIKDTLRPVEEALARQAAEATITAATGMYLGVQAVKDLGVKNAIELHNRACIMAIEHVGRRKGTEMDNE